MDLETEIHIERVKTMISSLGANKEKETAVERVTGMLTAPFVYI